MKKLNHIRRVLSVFLENESGSLSRVVGLFSQRGYNIESLTVAPTTDSSISRMTIYTIGDEKILNQIKNQLQKLVDVLSINELCKKNYIEREIMLIRVKISICKQSEIKKITKIFKGKIVDHNLKIFTIEMTGDSNKLDKFLKTLSNISKVLEIVRSGIIGVSKNNLNIA